MQIRPYLISQLTSTEDLSSDTQKDKFSSKKIKLTISLRAMKRKIPSDEALEACEKALKEIENWQKLEHIAMAVEEKWWLLSWQTETWVPKFVSNVCAFIIQGSKICKLDTDLIDL